MEIDVNKVARLSALKLSDEDLNLFREQLPDIFEHFQNIAAIDTGDLPPMVTPTEMEHVLRADDVENWESAEVALENAPAKSGNLFKVPPVVG